MLILAIDTSSRYGSVALLAGEEILAEVRTAAEGTHASHLVPCIELVLRVGGTAIAELDALACVTGPGSFTGLRVGLSTAQGLALGAQRVCVGVTALEALAEIARGRAPRVVALVDGFRSDVFAQKFDGDTGTPLDEPEATSPADIAGAAGDGSLVAFIGSGAERYHAALAGACGTAVFVPGTHYLASSAARLAARRVSEGLVVPPEELRPLYVRPPDIRPSRA